MDQADKKQYILESARYCFMHFGYKATTMDLIAKTAKMGKGTFYNFYKTKEEVFQQVLHRELEYFNTFAEKTKQMQPITEEVLLYYLKQALAYMQKGDLFYRLGAEAQTIGTPEVVQAMKQVGYVANLHMKELVILFVQYKGIKDCDIELTTFLLMELYGSLVYHWSEEHEPLTEQRIEEIFLKLYPLV